MTEYNKKLYYRANNETHSVKLYDSADDLDSAIAVRDGSITAYAAVGSITNAAASHLRIHASDITQAVLSEFIPAEELIHGDMDEGYFGTISSGAMNYIEPWKLLDAVWEVGASDKASLESQWGSKGNGTLQNLDTPWLKFAYEDKVLITPMKSIVRTISWNQINAKNAVFGKDISIDGVSYKCRLIKGANTDPVTGSGTARHDQSEWDKLMYKISAESVQGTADWAAFTASELGLDSLGSGLITWCQELDSGNARVNRGGNGIVNAFYGNGPGISHDNLGFRPVLELITE